MTQLKEVTLLVCGGLEGGQSGKGETRKEAVVVKARVRKRELK